jgi:hypothetical protein
MYPQKVAQDTAQVLQSYLTYQAVRTIIEQLSETNPTLAIWLSNYTANHRIQDGEAYLEGLLNDNKELVLRILTVREYLAQEVLDFLPEMVREGISKANIAHRKQLLERLTQTEQPPDHLNHSPEIDP